MVRLQAPLTPDTEQGRELLERELARPEYHELNIVQRLLDALQDLFDGNLRVPDSGPLSTLAAMVVMVALLVALGLLVSRFRGQARRRSSGAVLADDGVDAATLRARAEQAMSEQRYGDAVLDGYRALARRQVERGRLDDLPGTTAREVALVLGRLTPHEAAELASGADRFDAVLYGHHDADADAARAVLALEDRLRVVV